MIIQCTACDKKFSVPDAAITANGRLVQCSSCGNKWTQYPIIQNKTETKIIAKSSKNIGKKTIKKISKISSPAPYSKEYMQQKWGTSLESYTVKKKPLEVGDMYEADSKDMEMRQRIEDEIIPALIRSVLGNMSDITE